MQPAAAAAAEQLQADHAATKTAGRLKRAFLPVACWNEAAPFFSSRVAEMDAIRRSAQAAQAESAVGSRLCELCQPCSAESYRYFGYILLVQWVGVTCRVTSAQMHTTCLALHQIRTSGLQPRPHRDLTA